MHLDADRVLVAAPSTDSLSGTATVVYAHQEKPLLRGVPSISLATGGIQDLLLRAGAGQGNRTYPLLGSTSGTTPGTSVPGTSLTQPLNLDGYSNVVLAAGIVTPLFGQLDALGRADASVVIPTGLSTSLAGVRAHHAYVTLDFTQGAQVQFVSNATQLDARP